MTRPFNNTMQCPVCKTESTVETALGRWLRGCKELRSEDGINIFDEDYCCERRIVHRYKDEQGKRDVQLFMCIEVKTYGSNPSDAQKSSLSIYSQYLSNYTGNVHTQRGVTTDATGKKRKVFDKVFNRLVSVRHYGVHLLVFEKTSPEDSLWIKWDNKLISVKQFTDLMSFNIHPYTLQKLDARLHHKQKQLPLIQQAV